MEMALERKQLWVSKTLELFRGGRGILVYVPLFVGERFDGFFVASFGAQELLDSLLSEQASFGYSIAVFDGEEKIASRSDNNTAGRQLALGEPNHRDHASHPDCNDRPDGPA